MKSDNLAGYPNIDAFVRAKLARFETMERSFASLFALMFSEENNVFYEESQGYRVVTTTYGQAREAVHTRAAGLYAAMGHVPAGSIVGIHMQNSIRWIETFWAVLLCGYRPLLMNLRLSDAVLEQALQDCGAAFVISDGKIFSLPTVLEQELPAGGSFTPEKLGEEIFLMSSGTSEQLKLCAYTAEEFFHQVRNTLSIIRQSKQIKRHYEGQLKLLTILPFYHVFGLVAVYIWFAFFSRTLVHLGDLAPQTVLNTIRRHKVTHVFAVPLFWEKVYQQAVKTIRGRGEKTWERFCKGLRLCRKVGDVPLLGDWFCRTAFREIRENLFGESICFMITGGSVIAPEVLEFFNAIGYPLANGYGMTELSITSVELSGSKKLRRSGSVGQPLPSVEYRISQAGCLQVRATSAAKYILCGGSRRESDGWFDTGDLARCEKGHYFILGRSDDLIVGSSGENLNPNQLEQQLMLPGLRGVCLVGGQPITLLASVSGGITGEKLQELEDGLKGRIASLQLEGQIGRILFVSDSLLLEEEFKLNRRRLKKALAEGLLHPVTCGKTQQQQETSALWLQVRDMFATAVGRPAEEISATGDFFYDYGGSSLDYFAMIAQMQEEFSVSVPMESDRRLHSVQALYEWIGENMDYVD